MPKFSKRHYEALVQMIASVLTQDTSSMSHADIHRTWSNACIETLKTDNALFNPERFVKACKKALSERRQPGR